MFDLNHIRLTRRLVTGPAVAEVKVGEPLVSDGGHMCLRRGHVTTVLTDRMGQLFVTCDHGRHYLTHSQNSAGQLVGLTRKD